jgi:putative peptide zinc metalloprotease protein
MSEPRTLPLIRPDLTVQKLSDQEFVVKLRALRQYFRVGPEEAFLIEELKKPHTRSSLIHAFRNQIGQDLSRADVEDFVELAKARKLLIGTDDTDSPKATSDEEEDILASNKQSLLFYRIPLFNPDAAFSRWEPHIRWVWTTGFLCISAMFMLAALLVLWSNRSDLVTAFPSALRWETIALAWALIIFTTAIHEMAHGMTCKHFGGEVHDTGVLFMFFMPCLYANVSDAWLIPEKSKRLWITAAGGYCDLCIWAISVFIWRVTVQSSLINHLAFVTLSVCGGRSLLNFNPLLRLDGYYLVSDWLSIPNLRTRSQEYWMGHLRWWLWGAARPPNDPHGRVLLAYGMMSWFFALVFLDLVVLRLLEYSSDQLGMAGVIMTSILILLLMKRVFNGFFRSEFMAMFTERRRRAAIWAAGIASVLLGLFLIPSRHYASGSFEIRSSERHQITSPVAGYVRTVFVTDGELVKKGTPLVELESSDLENQISVKRSELTESEAVLRKLQAGQRPEEITDHRERVKRLESWCELGRIELVRATSQLEQELISLDQKIAQAEAELQSAQVAFQQSEQLYRSGALAGAELRADKTRLTVLQSQVRQAEALKKARETEGVRVAQTELSRREQELAEVKSRLILVSAGTRPEEIAAEDARRDRIAKELAYLEERRGRLIVRAPVDGVVASSRIQEQVGTLATQGAPLCTLEDAKQSFIEISVPEEEIVGLRPGQPVYLKARAIPFETFTATVDRIAPSTNAVAAAGKPVTTTLVVYCHLHDANGRLRTGMSGFGKIDRGWMSVGQLIATKAMRYLRTEFWW